MATTKNRLTLPYSHFRSDALCRLSLIIFLAVLIIAPEISKAQESRWKWIKTLSGRSTESGESISIDKNGNIYTLGAFSDTIDFDPGPATYYKTSKGMADIFISKLDSTGQFVWVKTMGGYGMDIGKAITVDTFGNIYILGEFSAISDFDPGSGGYFFEAKGNSDVVVCKLNSSGEFKWAKSISGSGIDTGEDIIVDGSGAVLITGSFTGICSFGEDGGSFTSATGYPDIFISKLDSLGGFQWVKTIGGKYDDKGNAIAVDDFGNVFTTGCFSDLVDFDPGPGNFILGNNHDYYYSTVFISKLDPSGQFVWAKGLTGVPWSEANSISLDAMNNLYIAGNYWQDDWGPYMLDFDPGPGNYFFDSSTFGGSFILKLSSSGDFSWAKPVGGHEYKSDNDLTVDLFGNIYYTGAYSGVIEFDLVSHTFVLSPSGGKDIFIFKMDSDGEFLWVAGAGGSQSENGSSIVIDAAGYAYITGKFESNNIKFNTFDPLNQAAAEKPDAFIIKVNNVDDNCRIDVVQHVADARCYGVPNGSISIVPSHGIHPINYIWSNGGTSARISGLQPGNYSVTFSDANACTGSFSFSISEPSEMDIELIVVHPTSPSGSGRIWITVTGGTGGYTYHWIDPLGATFFTEDLNNLTVSGYYTLTVTDANGCQKTLDPIFVDQISGTSPSIAYPTIRIFPVPAKDEIYLDINLPMDEVLISAMDGRLCKRLNKPENTVIDIHDLGPGVYFLRVLANGQWYTARMIK